jgi:uncharacterized membrane protein YcaP (DUF421 family)
MMWNVLRLWLEFLFGGDMPTQPLLLGQVAARALVVYLLGLLVVRLGKSRLLSGATALDIILAVVLGSLLSRGINGTASMSGTAVGCAVLVALHWSMTRAACRWHWLGNTIKGRSYLLVEKGRMDRDAMRRSNISEHDLLEELRLNANVEDLDQIEKAYKERSGQVSGVRRKFDAQIVEVAVESGVKTVRIEVRPR